jgi:hypothetical protein
VEVDVLYPISRFAGEARSVEVGDVCVVAVEDIEAVERKGDAPDMVGSPRVDDRGGIAFDGAILDEQRSRMPQTVMGSSVSASCAKADAQNTQQPKPTHCMSRARATPIHPGGAAVRMCTFRRRIRLLCDFSPVW